MNKFLSLILLLPSCSEPAINFEKEKQAILQIEKAQREYHFKKNAAAFTQVLSDSFLSVNKGTVTSPTKKENLERFNNYFNNTEFIKWDDVKEPIIRFSNDGSVAYVTVQKEVIIKQAGENSLPDTTHFAWVSIYKKEAAGWKIDCVASTNR
ncbi:MAG: nuclear transport factor 2 family protein [Bacteroidota bacterium]